MLEKKTIHLKSIGVDIKNILADTSLAFLFYLLLSRLLNLLNISFPSGMVTDTGIMLVFTPVLILLSFNSNYRAFLISWIRSTFILPVRGGNYQRSSLSVIVILSVLIIVDFLKILSPYPLTELAAYFCGYLLISLILSVTIKFLTPFNDDGTPPTDEFSRTVFIERIMACISNYIDSSKNDTNVLDEYSLSISIEGEWGEGKTWVARKLKKELLSKGKYGDKVTWVHFSPWLYSSATPEETYTTGLFESLSHAISKSYYLADLTNNFESYANAVVTGVANKYLGVSFPLQSMSPEDLKVNISNFLEQNDLFLVIVFDEIDRLSSKECLACLKLIRSIANFKNTVSISCLDSNRVLKMMDKSEDKIPPQYLEKIFQYRYSLPLTRVNKGVEMFYRKLKLGSDEQAQIEVMLENHLPRKNCGNLFTKKRFIDRIAQEFNQRKQYEGNNLNVADLLGILIIKHKAPLLYDRIRTNQHAFTYTYGGRDDIFEQEHRTLTLEDMQKLISDNMPGLSEKEVLSVRSILFALFPNVEAFIDRDEYFSSDVEGYPICSPDYFFRYFDNFDDANYNYGYMIKYLESIVNSKQKILQEPPEAVEYFLSQAFTGESTHLTSEQKTTLSEIEFDIDHQKYKTLDDVTPEDRSRGVELRCFLTEDIAKNCQLLQYYLNNSQGFDSAFFWASQYANKSYWDIERDSSVKDKQEKQTICTMPLVNILLPLFWERIKLPSFEALNMRSFEYFCRVYKRFSTIVGQELIFRESLHDLIKNNPDLIVKYIWALEDFDYNNFGDRDWKSKIPPFNSIKDKDELHAIFMMMEKINDFEGATLKGSFIKIKLALKDWLAQEKDNNEET